MIESARPAIDEALRLGLADPGPVTRQVIFDRVALHYRAQPRRWPKEGRCFYRRKGDGYFVGLLIDDKHYDPDMAANGREVDARGGRRGRALLDRYAVPPYGRRQGPRRRLRNAPGARLLRPRIVAGFDPRPYTRDWFLHRDEERYLGFLLARSREVRDARLGRYRALSHRAAVFAHAGIVSRVRPALPSSMPSRTAMCVVEDVISAPS